VEEYHRALKTGCRYEHSQLRSRERLLALLGFLSLVAARLLTVRAPPEPGP
jgi:hypothetical protein